MEELVKNIFTLLEYFVVGLVGLVILQLSPQFRTFWSNQIDHFSYGTPLKTRYAIKLMSFGVTAFLLGVIVDRSAYVFLDREHKRIIHTVVKDFCGSDQERKEAQGLAPYSYFSSFFPEEKKSKKLG